METNEPNQGEGEPVTDSPDPGAVDPADVHETDAAAGGHETDDAATVPADAADPTEGSEPAPSAGHDDAVDDDEDGGASRRVLIDLAVRRRDDLTPDSLRRVLATLDVDVDAETLAEDLKRLDISLVPQPDGRTFLRHADSDEPAEHDGFYPNEAERPFRNPVVLGAIGVGVVVVVIIVALIASSGGGKSHDNGSVATGAAGQSTAGKGKGKFVTGPPAVPHPDPLLNAKTDLTDPFATNGTGLGTYPGVGPWIVAQGTWAVLNQQATLVKTAPLGPSLAFFDAGTPNWRAEVRVVTEGPGGAGIAFRVIDPKNYWVWTVTPGYASVDLVRVQNGVARIVLDQVDVVVPKAGIVLGVVANGAKISLLVQGKVVKGVFDNAPKPGEGIGLGSFSKAKGASFDDFVFKKTA